MTGVSSTVVFHVQVVTYDDMIEMLTDYRYITDVTSDAGGDIEMWGAEAGYGIIFANQMLGWIATNCQESCSGEWSRPERLRASEHTS